jgi:hypothetical protein
MLVGLHAAYAQAIALLPRNVCQQALHSTSRA